jgi:hypothetical protein
MLPVPLHPPLERGVPTQRVFAMPLLVHGTSVALIAAGLNWTHVSTGTSGDQAVGGVTARRRRSTVVRCVRELSLLAR